MNAAQASNPGILSVSGAVLLGAASIAAYDNGEVQGYISSIEQVAEITILSFTGFTKLLAAFGVSGFANKWFNRAIAFAPFLAIWLLLPHVLAYGADGAAGVRAGFSILVTIGLVMFGVLDSVNSWFTSTIHKVGETAAEATARLDAMKRAATGGDR